jgi:mgtE-like transporter
MKSLKTHLERLNAIKRKKYHPLIHRIHKKHGISKKTLFYIKEYGPHTHIPWVILKESIKILLFASIISSFGGFALESIKGVFVSIAPLLIILPALNSIIGGYGTIISSKLSTMIHEGLIDKMMWGQEYIKKMFKKVIVLAVINALFSSAMALAFSTFAGYSPSPIVFLKVLAISLIDIVFLVIVLFFVSIFAGLYFFRKQEDPNNLLIPLTTSIADFGNMVILAGLVLLFF